MSRRQFLQTAGAAGVALAAQDALAGAADAPVVTAFKPIKNAVPYTARPLPLSAVRLTGGPLKHAQDLDARYLLALQPDRVMAHLRQRVGLPTKAQGYGGWEGPGRNLTGHIPGHYLSAVSLMYAATGDARYKERANYIVAEMKAVQDKDPDGYIGALMDKNGVDGKTCFAQVAQGDIRSGGFDLNGLWSPWYVQHKLFAGLRDAYRCTGSRMALKVEARLAAWAETVVGKLDDAQVQKMLRTEFGGMNEVLADLYADTGDRRWLALSDRFQHREVLEPLARREDHLGGLHGNCQIPKLIGSLARHLYTGDAADGIAAAYFWDAVVDHHSFVTGGHGKDEYFGPPDKLNDRVDGRTDESCNVYNMLKLTRTLFSLHPDIRYAEFHERALFNHVLGSMDPQDGRTCYMVPVGRGVQHEYQNMHESFTCCVGTGMESHALHGYGLYYEAGDRLWVNLYAPSIADWKAKGLTLTTETGFPEGETVTLKLTLRAPRQFTLSLRRPSWAGAGFTVTVNGAEVGGLSAPGSYIDMKRAWKSGDTVTLTLPKTLHAEPLPDNPRRVALLWGPLALAGDLGPEHGDDGGSARQHGIPVFVAAARPLSEWLKPTGAAPGAFRSDDVGRDSADGHPTDVDFMPFYQLHRRRYAAYWDLTTPQEWEHKAAEFVNPNEETDLNRVTLYSNGTGVFDRAYTLQDRRPLAIAIPIRNDSLDEAIATIGVFGEVTLTEPPSYTPIGNATDNLTIDPLNVIRDLSTRLRGARVALQAGTETVSGRLAGIQTFVETTGEREIERFRVALLDEEGAFRTFADREIAALRFTEPSVQTEIDKALQRAFETIKPNSTYVNLTLAPDVDGEIEARVQYAVAQLGAWKISYRLRGSETEGVWELEGQAVVDNSTDEPWDDVLVSVISGAPISFATDLAEIRAVRRSRINVVADQALNAAMAAAVVPESLHDGEAMTLLSASAPSGSRQKLAYVRGGFDMMQEEQSRAATPARRARQEQAQARELGDAVEYTAPFPVSIGANRSAIIPMFSRRWREQSRSCSTCPIATPSARIAPCASPIPQRIRWAMASVRSSKQALTSAKRFWKAASRARSARFLTRWRRVFASLMEQKEFATHTAQIRITAGAAVMEQVIQGLTLYKIRNGTATAFTLEAEHTFRLSERSYRVQVAPSGEAAVLPIADGVRIGMELPAKADLTIAVHETQIMEQRLTLSDMGYGLPWLRAVLTADHPLYQDPGVRECLRLQEAVDAAKRALDIAVSHVNAILEEQERIKGLLHAGGHEGAANEWRTNLAQNERLIKEAKTMQIPQLEQSVREAEQALQQALNTLTLSWRVEPPAG